MSKLSKFFKKLGHQISVNFKHGKKYIAPMVISALTGGFGTGILNSLGSAGGKGFGTLLNHGANKVLGNLFGGKTASAITNVINKDTPAREIGSTGTSVAQNATADWFRPIVKAWDTSMIVTPAANKLAQMENRDAIEAANNKSNSQVNSLADLFENIDTPEIKLRNPDLGSIQPVSSVEANRWVGKSSNQNEDTDDGYEEYYDDNGILRRRKKAMALNPLFNDGNTDIPAANITA